MLYPLLSMLGVTKEEAKEINAKRSKAKLKVKSKDKLTKFMQ